MPFVEQNLPIAEGWVQCQWQEHDFCDWERYLNDSPGPDKNFTMLRISINNDDGHAYITIHEYSGERLCYSLEFPLTLKQALIIIQGEK